MVGEVGLFGLIQCTTFARVGGHSSAGAGGGLFRCDLTDGVAHSYWAIGAKKKAPDNRCFLVVHYTIISMSIDAIGYGTAFVISVSIANRVPLS